MRILLVQLDGKIPNIALMRISAHHKALGDEVELRFGASFTRQLWDEEFEKVYASLIFLRTRWLGENLLRQHPAAILGGTGWDLASSLEKIGITSLAQDYSIYPRFRQSIGFTQRGCRLRCSFCVVPAKEGSVLSPGHDIITNNPLVRLQGLPLNPAFAEPKCLRPSTGGSENGEFHAFWRLKYILPGLWKRFCAQLQ